MAKEKKKGKKKKDSGGPRETVRGAVESTFQRAAGGAQELLDDVATMVKSLRDANLVEALEGLRDEVQTLAKRVAALEVRQAPEPVKPSRPAVRRTATATRTPAARKPAARKPAARKPATRSAAKPATGRSAAKPATSRSTARPAASRSAAKPRSPRPPKAS